ncbi:hypothetical protein [Nonomuraea pusilla]|uniref:Uncharacterized protein n=1 Tax=Nonomuraea pusilla TaxID=46177 RepID=A0A1H8I4R8_9ACTN|nr:hypothetical protein [Nonomuraea pusilla]SEN63036.1 hypothetical protein SAMN05660976_07954 [Nonomuraea pusilla]
MLRTLAGALLVAATATTLVAAPASAATSTTSTASAASTATTAGKAAVSATTAGPQLIRTTIRFGRCKDTCRINVRIKNISRTTLRDVSLSANLKVNGRKVGSCYKYVGGMRPGQTRLAGCTVTSRTLARMWSNFSHRRIRTFNTHASTVVRYRYYR